MSASHFCPASSSTTTSSSMGAETYGEIEQDQNGLENNHHHKQQMGWPINGTEQQKEGEEGAQSQRVTMENFALIRVLGKGGETIKQYK